MLFTHYHQFNLPSIVILKIFSQLYMRNLLIKDVKIIPKSFKRKMVPIQLFSENPHLLSAFQEA